VTKWLGVIGLTILCAACGGTDATQPAADAAETPLTAGDAKPAVTKAGAQYREVTIPAGTSLRLDLASSLATDQSHVEDAVKATLRQAVVVDGQTVIPTGAELAGVVTDVDDSGRVKGRAHIAYRFSSLRVGDERYDITTAPVSHLAAATKGEDAKKIAIGAGAGAALGALLGGGDGAAKGAAIGGAGGTGVVLATKGKEVRLGPGANVSTRLTAPLTVRVKL
jgi:hypothetical protein